MASNTENLDLLMKNPSTDGADTFNVQTMLNENWQKIDNNAGTVAQALANILKPTTPPLIGLPPSTTPDGMFQALGNTGELHVWRKTITSGTGTYSLGAVQEGLHYIKWANNSATSDSSGTFEYGSEIAVNNDGTITGIKNPSTITIKPWDDDASKANVFKGKFIKMISQVETSMSHFKIGEIWWIPADAVMTKGLLNGESGRWYIAASKRQQVVGVPAGTTTTYPVSTNPNAYQEGDDAKEAGYVVGEVVSGKFRVSLSYANGDASWKYGTSLTVSDDGTVNIANPSSVSLSGSSSSVASAAQQMAGKYAVCISVSDPGYEPDFPIGTVVFFPSDTLFTRLDSSCWASKYQPVTGYAAIPAGTTIEYLGKLGDKARVQVVSYVGTGTYGSSNPNSLTFGSLPEAIIFLGYIDRSGSVYSQFYTQDETRVLYPKIIPNGRNYVNGYGFGYIIQGKRDGNTISWYSTQNQDSQANIIGYTYYYLVLS